MGRLRREKRTCLKCRRRFVSQGNRVCDSCNEENMDFWGVRGRVGASEDAAALGGRAREIASGEDDEETEEEDLEMVRVLLAGADEAADPEAKPDDDVLWPAPNEDEDVGAEEAACSDGRGCEGEENRDDSIKEI